MIELIVNEHRLPKTRIVVHMIELIVNEHRLPILSVHKHTISHVHEFF